MPPERNYDPAAGRDARVAAKNKERTSGMDSIDKQNADAAEMARRASEQERQQQESRRQHEQFQQTIQARETADRASAQPRIESAHKEALALAKSVDAGRRTFDAPKAEAGMVQTVGDTSWEQKIAPLPKAEAPKPPAKKKFFGLFG